MIREDLEALAVGGNGSAVVAFAVEATDGTARVFASVREPGAKPTAAAPRGFSPAVPISGPIVGGNEFSHAPITSIQAIVDGAGNVTVAWLGDQQTTDPNGSAVWVRSKPAGGTWGATQLVTEQYLFPNSPIDPPELVGATNGRAALRAAGVLFERAPGATQFTRSTVNTYPLHIAMDPAGDLAVIQFGSGPGGEEYSPVEVAVRPAGGAWHATREVGTLYSGFPWEANRAAISVTPNGTVVAAWTRGLVTPDDTYGVSAAVRLPGATFANGTWSAAQSLGNTDTGTPDPTTRVDGPGTVAVGWFRAYDGSSEIERIVPGSAPAKQIKPSEAFAVSPGLGGQALAVPFRPATSPLTASARATASAAFGAPVSVIAPAGTANAYYDPLVALDDQGNGYLSWVRGITNPGGAPDTYLVGVSGYDPVAPVVTSTVPGTALVGTAVSLAATATDRMSTVALSWSFGDGTTGTGTAVSHSYAAAGTYSVKVTATDEAGNVSSVTKSIVVSKAALPKVDARPALWTPSYAGGKTTVRTLELFDLKVNDTVKITCTGTGCVPIGTQSFTVKTATTKLVTSFGTAGMQLATGATLTVVVGRSGSQAQTAKFTMNAGKAPTRVITY